MKKFLTILAIVTTTITTVIIAQGSAVKIPRCRHNYCLKMRKTTNRIFSYNQYQFQREIAKQQRIERNRGNKFLFWKNYNRQISRNYVKQNYATYRATHSSLFPRNNNVIPQPHKIAVRETEYHQNYKWDSLKKTELIQEHNKATFYMEKGNGYSVKMPKSFIKNADGKFYDTMRDLTVEITSEDNLNCAGLSFQLCASQENAKFRENMDNIQDLSQKFRARQVSVGGNTVLFPTYQETFESNGQVYFSYTNQNPLTGNTVTLSGFAPTDNKFASSNLMETLFSNLQL